MKRQITIVAAILALMLAPVICSGQAKIYTKKARLEDFTSKTTKVVAGGLSPMAIDIQNEIRSRWHVSPYEICAIEDYEAARSDNGLYFLRLVQEEGVMFLSLSKGGQENAADMKARPFEVVRIPVSSSDGSSIDGFAFTGAFVDMVQRFAQDAMESDLIGYAGLKSTGSRKLDGKAVVLDPEKARKAMLEGYSGTLAGIVVAPSFVSFKTKCYKMLIDCESHELFWYSESPYLSPSDAAFNEKDIKTITKRHGVIAE